MIPMEVSGQTRQKSEKFNSQIQLVKSKVPSAPEQFPSFLHRWNSNEEIASLLLALEKHDSWLSPEVKLRPKSGSLLLFSRQAVRGYRRDGFCWKKRRDGRTTREDHMKLKVQGEEFIYGCYVHSAVLPTFHRRSYWLLSNPDIVLVHYLNVPSTQRDNSDVLHSVLQHYNENKSWNYDDLIEELTPMFFGCETLDTSKHIIHCIADNLTCRHQQVSTSEDSSTKSSIIVTKHSNIQNVQPFYLMPSSRGLIILSSHSGIQHKQQNECLSTTKNDAAANKNNLLNNKSNALPIKTEFDLGLCSDPDDLQRTLMANMPSNQPAPSEANATDHLDLNLLDDLVGTFNVDETTNSNCVANITDVSPEWAYTDGSQKILVTGPWYSTSSTYSIHFDTIPVNASLVQNGVLRCIAPPHIAGQVKVEVACDGEIITNSYQFTYRQRLDDVQCLPVLPAKNTLHAMLVERLFHLAERIDLNNDVNEKFKLLHKESAIVEACEHLTIRKWLHPTHIINGNRNCMLLAASLGYVQLMHTLHRWSNYCSAPAIIHESNIRIKDENDLTPLMAACLNNHLDVVRTLCEWLNLEHHQGITKRVSVDVIPFNTQSTNINNNNNNNNDEFLHPSPYPNTQLIQMDTDQIPDLSSDDTTSTCSNDLFSVDTHSGQMVSLVNQIIAAIPDHIKSSTSNRCQHSSESSSVITDDSGIMDASSMNTTADVINLSPVMPVIDSPTPSMYDLGEYFNAPYLERDMERLTLSDDEQRKLYEAAVIIQNFFRKYKHRQHERHREIDAAVLIQSYYRRYKQYAFYKRMSQAAVTIQSQFRSYYAQKRYRRSREAATLIQNQYRAYREHEKFKKSRNAAIIIQQRFRSHYQRKKQLLEIQKRTKGVLDS